jgi:N-acetylglucosaminyl-diphospho-decaprenol L-rhamnosyltransferase
MLSVVIVSFNAREPLRRCLTTLFEHQSGDFEVIVVDNASADGSPDLVTSDFPGTCLIRNATNEGFAVAANIGARAANGDVILFLNPDSELQDDAFSAPADYLRSHPDVAVLGIKVLNPDGTLQLSVRRFPGLQTALFNRYSLLTRLWPNNRFSRSYLMSDWNHGDISDVDWVSGACLMTTRAVIDRIGYFDEGYFWGFEDVDFCKRAHDAGLRVVYYPHTSVIHAIGASARTVPTRALIARHKGMWRYYKHHLCSNVLLDAAVLLGIAIRCGFFVLSSQLKRMRQK